MRLNKVLTVAGTELSSNCDVLVGPLGSWIALPLDTHGEISSDVRRFPSRLKSKSAHGARQGASSAGTPSKGGVTYVTDSPTQQHSSRGRRPRESDQNRLHACSVQRVSWFTYVVVGETGIIVDDHKQRLLPAFACSKRFEDVLLAALTCEGKSARQSDKTLVDTMLL